MGKGKFKVFKRKKGDGPKVLDLPGGNGKKKERVFVGIPHVGDDISLVIVNFVNALHNMNADPECPWSFTVCIEQNKRPVYYARNCIVGRFLESDCERLWFIDADMLPPPTAFQVLHAEGDIVAARMYAIKRNADQSPRLELCAFKYVEDDKKFHSIAPIPGVTPVICDVDAVGTGCTVVRRKVLEDKRLWGESTYDWNGKQGDVLQEKDDEGTSAPPIFRWHEKPNGKPLRGEDLDFTWRAKQLGYSVRVNPGADCGHIKSMNLDDSLLLARQIVDNMRASAEEKEQCESAG